jgi:Gluconate 2-dehydrogenase subunit 3
LSWREGDPYRLPRQRRGTTPQLHGRYPDYDVLEQAQHWDEATRKVVLDRVENVPEILFFDALEARTLRAFCDTVTGQDAEPRIPVLAYIDDKLHSGRLDGYQYYDLPDDCELWRRVARGLDQEAQRRGAPSFADAEPELQEAICGDFAEAKLHGGVWSTVSVSRAWTVVMGHVVQAFYAHPWAWNEIGFGGPAYPRGYSRFGSPHLDKAEREEWEGEEAVSPDPVQEQL